MMSAPWFSHSNGSVSAAAPSLSVLVFSESIDIVHRSGTEFHDPASVLCAVEVDVGLVCVSSWPVLTMTYLL